MPNGVTLPSTGSGKSWSRTRTGSPCGRQARPARQNPPSCSFFFPSTLITGPPAAVNCAITALTCRNWASRSGCCCPSSHPRHALHAVAGLAQHPGQRVLPGPEPQPGHLPLQVPQRQRRPLQRHHRVAPQWPPPAARRALPLTPAARPRPSGDPHPDHLERLGEIWDGRSVDIVTSPAVIVNSDDTLEWIGADLGVPSVRAWLQRENPNVMASVSVRAQLARDVGGWDAGQSRAGDWDLWKRVLATGDRAADTGEPTVLHFRATGREQSWPDRVIQNTRWLERISVSSRLPELRSSLRQARVDREAMLSETVANLQARQAEVEGSRWWRLGEELRPFWRRTRNYWR